MNILEEVNEAQPSNKYSVLGIATSVCTGALAPPPVSPQAGQSFAQHQATISKSFVAFQNPKLIVDACQWLCFRHDDGNITIAIL